MQVLKNKIRIYYYGNIPIHQYIFIIYEYKSTQIKILYENIHILIY